MKPIHSARLLLFGVVVVLVAHSPNPEREPVDDEIARVRHHLERAERFLITYEPDNLTNIQRARRAEVVRLVSQYRLNGVFPHHHEAGREMELYFVDEHGTPCALASVMQQTGGEALVEAVRVRQNHGWVRDIMGVPDLRLGLKDWLDDHGLTFADAATIQVPGYSIAGPEAEITPAYAVASGLSVGAGAVTSAINLSNLTSRGPTPAWLGLLSGAAAVGLGVTQLDTRGSRLTLATVDVVGGLLSVTTSAVRLLVGDRRSDDQPSFSNHFRPALHTDGKGNSHFSIRLAF